MKQLMELGAKQDVPLSALLSMRVGGKADFVLNIDNETALTEAMRIDMPKILMGNGTNLLASDEGFRGLVLCLDKPWYSPKWDGESVTVSAGASLTTLAKESVERGLSGLERLCGIPGTVGGACAMNAGAYGSEIKDVLKRVRVYHDGKIEWRCVEDKDLGYRRSVYSFPGFIVLEAELRLGRDDGSARETMHSCMEQRRLKQPLEYPSAGSTFKRPEGYYAGALIEQCGLKGKRIGGACVSKKHAGFIVNDNHASAKDVIELIELVQRTVLEKTGVLLECEVKRI